VGVSALAIQRALIILKKIASSQEGVGVRGLSREIGCSPAVIQKTLQALVEQGFARQDETTSRYHLGPEALRVGLAGLVRLEIRQTARPFLEVLAERTGETAMLGVVKGEEVVYIEKVVSHADIKMDPPIGTHRPINCASIGKAILAYYPEQELQRLAKSAFVKSTSKSVTDLMELKLQLSRIRETGLAYDIGEVVPDAMCIGAPVFDHEGAAVAAVAVAGPMNRIEEKVSEMGKHVAECANGISFALGYHRQSS
jgi:IclR family transcriptional regulator, KDG regulon repressor